MESTRRPLDRSLMRESGLKKPRLSEDFATSNGRAGFIQRPMGSNSGGGGRVQRELDSESSDSVRGPYQQQTGQQLHQELVNQYKTALAELTFNSKPIITNLTIIAGENSHAAKAIAATVCSNILEVPDEQKLPSLYLLDSIVKNIGKDYIKYFGSRLPEVFCKAYRQVDPSIHPGMRHLFGTWKGVFPPQPLQMIERELGFSTSVNGSSSGATSRPDPQAQRPGHSIHVNPKYLEARQRLQSLKARGAGSDISVSVLNSHEDVIALERTTSTNSGRSWTDPYSKFKQNISCKSTNGMNKSWKNTEEEEYVWDGMNSRQIDPTEVDTSAKDKWTSDNYDRLDFDVHPQRPRNMNETGSRFGDETSVDSMSAELDQTPSGTQLPLSRSKELLPQEDRRFLQSGNNVSVYSQEYSSGFRSSANPLTRTSLQSQLGLPQTGAPSSKAPANVLRGPKVSTTRLQHTLGAPLASARTPTYHPIELPNNFTERHLSSATPPTDPRRPLGPKSSGAQDDYSHDSLPLPSRDVYQATQRFQAQNLRNLSAPLLPFQQRKQVPSIQQRKPEDSEFESSGDGQQLLPLPSSISESQSTMGDSSSDHSNPLTIDSPGQSITSSLLSAKSFKPSSSAKVTKSSSQVGKELSQLRPPLSSGPASASIPSSSQLDGKRFLPGLSQKKLKQPPLPAGPPSSVAGIGSEQNQNAVNSKSDPVSNLLSSLVAKGLISASKSDSQTSTSTLKPEQLPDRGPGVASTSSTPFSSVPVIATIPASSSADEPLSLRPSTEGTDNFAESTGKIKNLIGFEFKPNVVRNLHPDVITDLVSELPHECSLCGLRLKLQERLDRHMEWHALRLPEQKCSSSASRRWYANSVDWIAGNSEPLPDSPSESEESVEISESTLQVVPADESQCACVLCGELFEDFYSVERNEWMFKEAIYLTVPLSDSHEKIGITDDTASLNPIVHANCISAVPDYDVKLEKDA